MNCLICQAPAKLVFKVNGFEIFECIDCSHQMATPKDRGQHVSRIYSDNYFFGGGAGYPNYLDEREILINHGRQYGEILRRYLDQDAFIFDVGTAAGFIAKGMAECGLRVQGVEPNTTMADYARNVLHLNVSTGSIESYQPAEKFSSICFIQVIAHLIDPRSVLEACAHFLSTNGFILVETWDYRAWSARMFGRRWHEYSPPSVLHWFSRKGLDRLARKFRLRKIASGRPVKKISWKHALSLIHYQLTGHPIIQKTTSLGTVLPNRMAIPYPFEDLFWVLYRKTP